MLFEICISILIFSLIPITVKFTNANAFTIGFFRLLVASILVSLFWNKKINFKAYKKKNFWKLVFIGLAFFFHWITYTYSIKIAGPSICVLGMATYGVQLIFYGAYFLGHKITKKNLVCLVLILFGVILVIPSWDFHDRTTLGLGLALLSASFYSTIPILLQKSHEFSQESRIFFQFSIAFLCYLALFPLTDWTSLMSVDWIALIFLAVMGTFVAHTLWSKIVSQLPTTTTGIIYYLITPLAMILAALILGEKLTLIQQIGGGVILAGALLNSLNQARFKTAYDKFLSKK